MKHPVNQKLVDYVEKNVIPLYDSFDKAHRRDHALAVIGRALELSSYYDVDCDIVYAAAACHDIGLSAGRDIHHLESGKLIRANAVLKELLGADGVELAAQAAEDHRASADHEPRSIYGRIIAEADRQIEPLTVIRRTVQYGLGHYPELDKEAHWERTQAHLKEKYDYGGYLKLWIPESPNAAKLEELRKMIADKSLLRSLFEKIWEEETNKK